MNIQIKEMYSLKEVQVNTKATNNDEYLNRVWNELPTPGIVDGGLFCIWWSILVGKSGPAGFYCKIKYGMMLEFPTLQICI